MKLASLAVIAALVGTAVNAQERQVVVCTGSGVKQEIAVPAKTQASKMFSAIGVKLQWRSSWACVKEPSQAIVVTFSMMTPNDLRPGALAYSLPFEGIHLKIFYDRICEASYSDRAPILAHVLVHEIAHILQGTNRHSTGVMKARWDAADFAKMRKSSLTFEPMDVLLIQRGLDSRAARNTIGSSITTEKVTDAMAGGPR
jgi:hypothetical protein